MDSTDRTEAQSIPLAAAPVRAGEAAWRTGWACDSEGFLAVASARCPQAVLADRTVDLYEIVGDAAPADLSRVEVLGTGRD